MDVTVRDSLLAYPGLSDCEDYLTKVVLPSRGLDGDDLASCVDPDLLKLAAADLYAMAGCLPDFTENKLSMAYPRQWYNATARRLYTEGGEPEKAASVGGGIIVPKGRAGRRW